MFATEAIGEQIGSLLFGFRAKVFIVQFISTLNQSCLWVHFM